MTISKNISEYIENTKVNKKFTKWNKSTVYLYITEITTATNLKEYYYNEVRKGITTWNKVLSENNIPIKFEQTETAKSADIIIHWVKVGRVFEGMCKYLSIINNEIKKVSIEIGLENEYSSKNTTNESIFFTIMHELGHSLGLGHGVDIDDVMYVPHKKNISKPSENDIYVLKEIYK